MPKTECKTGALSANPRDWIAEMPILVLNVHSKCNCRCVMCDIWKKTESMELSVEALKQHREALRRLAVRWVVLSGGEPLMHSELEALCMFFRELDIRLTLLTTGLLLRKRAAEVAEMFDDIIVSLDGPPAIHDAIRRIKGAYHLIETGIHSVRQFRPTIRIAGRATVQKANHHHLQDTVLSAKSIGLTSISFLAADLTSTAFNRPLLWPVERQSEIALTAGEVSILKQEVEGLIANYAEEIRSGYIVESVTKLRSIVRHFEAHIGTCGPKSPVCNAPWVSAVVEADGSVRPCFFHHTIGNIHHSSLEDIVNSQQAQIFRHQLSIDEDPICRRCVCPLNYSKTNGYKE